MDMDTIRVLLIDDSVVVRRFLADVISAEPGVEVAAAAPNGRIGLAKIDQAAPDLVVLDLEMPEMDGLQTLVEIRRRRPLLPVVMYSSLTQRGARATLDALELGANDYVTKPERTGSVEEAARRVRDDLVPKIRALVGGPRAAAPARGVGPAGPRPAGPTEDRRPEAPPSNGPVEIVAIGASTGGPNALTALLPALPRDFPAPIVVVQHMPPVFTAMLAERLNAKSEVAVSEARHGDVLEPGRAWIAPGDFHMVVAPSAGRLRVELNRLPQENSCRPSVDVLFRSVAEARGAGALAVVLTGMGADGLRGCGLIRRAGGTVFVQDEPTSVVWGMPGFVARAGLAARVLPLEAIAPAVAARVRAQRPVHQSA